MKLRIRPTFPLYMAALCAVMTVFQLVLWTSSGELIALLAAIPAVISGVYGVIVHMMFAEKR